VRAAAELLVTGGRNAVTTRAVSAAGREQLGGGAHDPGSSVQPQLPR